MRFALAALLLGCVCLGGCGGGSDGENSTGAASAPSSEAQSAEASIEGFGEEAEGSERAELLATFHGYLGALAGEDDEGACGYLGGQVRTSLARLASKAKRTPSCAELLAALLSPQAAAIARSQEQGRIHKVRADGESAFVVFKAPGARLYQLNLIREGEEWKVSSLSASVLAPALPAEAQQGGKS